MLHEKGLRFDAQENSRSSKFEILRIISLLFIIAHHYAIHGGALGIDLSANKIIAQFLVVGGKLGVNCFILISGYFLIDSKFKFKKLLKIMCEVLFYSVAILIVFKMFDLTSIGLKSIIKSILPTIFSQYWFASAYIGLYILTPFLNDLIKNLNPKRYISLLVILTVMLSVIPTLTTSNLYYSNLTWFIYLYFLAGYINRYSIKFLERKHIALTVFILMYLLIFASSIVFAVAAQKYQISDKIIIYFSNINVIPLLLCSIALFMYFKNIEIKSNKYINIIAQTTFGIYLIHDNTFMRNYLWHEIVKTESFYNSNLLILHAIITIICTFIVCSIIDLVRINTIEKFTYKIVDKYCDKIDLRISDFVNK